LRVQQREFGERRGEQGIGIKAKKNYYYDYYLRKKQKEEEKQQFMIYLDVSLCVAKILEKRTG